MHVFSHTAAGGRHIPQKNKSVIGAQGVGRWGVPLRITAQNAVRGARKGLILNAFARGGAEKIQNSWIFSVFLIGNSLLFNRLWVVAGGEIPFIFGIFLSDMKYEPNFAVWYPACISSVSSSSLQTEYCAGVLVSIAIALLSVFCSLSPTSPFH